MTSHKFFFVLVFGVWTVSFIVHSSGLHLFPKLVTEQFSSFAFFDDAVYLRLDRGRPDLAEAYVGHMVISSFYMFAAIPMLLLTVMTQVLIRLRLTNDQRRIQASFLWSCGLLVCAGSYVILADSHSSFVDADRRFRGMPLWWIFLITTFVWPIVVFMIGLAIREPALVRKNWKL